MKFLCYETSENRLKARCDFLNGAGCVGHCATDLETAANLLHSCHYDVAVVGPTLSAEELVALENVVNAISPGTKIVRLGMRDDEVIRGDITLQLLGELSRLEAEQQQLLAGGS